MISINGAIKVSQREAKGQGQAIAKTSGHVIRIEGQNKWMTIIQNAANLTQGSDDKSL